MMYHPVDTVNASAPVDCFEYRTSGDYFIIFDAVQNHSTTHFVRQYDR